MDVHISGHVTRGLRRRGVDVLTVQEDNAREFEDSMLLDRATILGRILVTQDDDFLAEAAERQRNSRQFEGIAFAPTRSLSIGQFIANLQLIAECYERSDMLDRVEFLPL